MSADSHKRSIVIRPTTVYVDLAALRANVAAIRRRVAPAKIMAIVKANAYGHGLIDTAQALLRFGVDQLGVGFLEEGIELRRAGVQAPILVLGGIIGNQVVHYLEYDLDLTASSIFKLEQINEVAATLKKKAHVHLKIDTGMERIGIHWDNAHTLFEAAARMAHCEVRGVFSHFADSENSDPQATKRQLERFNTALDFFPRHSLPMPTRHIANSGAILQHPESFFEMVRPGLLLYGVYPTADISRSVVVEPAMSWKTRVVYFKVVKQGSAVSYGGRWTAPRDTRVVTLPVGYGDGYPRAYSNKGQVLLGGKRYPVVGTVTMDAVMVDIGADSGHNGDEVVLLGRQGNDRIDVAELAAWRDTIPYEVLTSIGVRVPRVHIDGD